MTGYGVATSRLIDTIVAEAIDTATYTGRPEFRSSTLNALAAVDRADFVEPCRGVDAYENRPLAIGYGQTISQPFVVALMTDLLDVNESSRVLEIGTGSGYQAAVLGRLAGVVHSVEILPMLADRARRNLVFEICKNIRKFVYLIFVVYKNNHFPDSFCKLLYNC